MTRAYGEVAIDDPKVLAVIQTPTFRRLDGVKQAGPSAFAFPFKTVTRFEHSLGVYLLLRRLVRAPASRSPGSSTTSRTRPSRTPSTSSSRPRSRTTPTRP